jgi:uncharacterized membrane protein
MNKNEFLNKLDKSLNNLPYEERKDIIEDFQEHFEIGKTENKSDKEIVSALGSPNQIAKEILANYYLEKIEKTSSTKNIFSAIWAVIGLGFFNLVIVAGPLIAIAAIILSGWIAGGAFTISPLLFLINLIIFPGQFNYLDLFSSIALTGVGLLLIIGMYYVTYWSQKIFIQYLKFNVRMVKGGLKHD